MKINEIREKDVDALKHELLDKQKHLFDLRSQAVTEKLEDPTRLGKARRQIAQIKTILRQREIEVESKAAAEKKAAAASKLAAEKKASAEKKAAFKARSAAGQKASADKKAAAATAGQ